MDFEKFLKYHHGDGHPEETMVAKLCKYFGLSKWDSFRAVYYYSMCYNLIDPWRMLQAKQPLPKGDIDFVTDRRYVRCGDNYEKLLKQLQPSLMERLCGCKTTTQQYKEVSGWYFFGRYATYLFLEVWNYLYPAEIDDFIPAWEKKELYTQGAIALIGGIYNKQALDNFIVKCKQSTGDTAFSIETSLCGWAKMIKGTRYNGYYTDRMLSYTNGTKIGNIILKLL